MKKYLIMMLCFLLLISGCTKSSDGSSVAEPPTEEAEEVVPALSPEEMAELERQAEETRLAQEVEDALKHLTLEEKVGQLFFAACPATDAPSAVTQYHLGGILLFTRDYQDISGNWLTAETFAEKISSLQTAAQDDTGISLFIGSDEEGGTVTRASRNPNLFESKFPSPQTLYQTEGLEGLLIKTTSFNEQLLSYGVNVNFAPVCDISTHSTDFIYDRSFGQDAAATADYISQVVTAMGSAGVGSVLKHFPGYGSNVDTHTGIAMDTRPYEQFTAEDYLPFLSGIDAGAPFVLVSHNIVTCLDEAYPASLSPAWHVQLRSHLGFDGIILTDDLNMGAVQSYAKEGNIAVLALQAGNDMIVTTDFEQQISTILDAVENGTLSEDIINNACRRVLTGKQRLHLL
ncbi:MAG: beta-hexosaminidase [Oscillibacter sp.]|nr:beta-hexosaminidase [Oscillibacter sp.]